MGDDDDEPLDDDVDRDEMFRTFGLKRPERHRITVEGRDYWVYEDGRMVPVEPPESEGSTKH